MVGSLLAAIGLTFIVTDSKILKKLREWVSARKIEFIDEVINCPHCFGVWAGLIIAVVKWSYFIELPLATSFCCYLFSTIIMYLKRH